MDHERCREGQGEVNGAGRETLVRVCYTCLDVLNVGEALSLEQILGHVLWCDTDAGERSSGIRVVSSLSPPEAAKNGAT